MNVSPLDADPPIGSETELEVLCDHPSQRCQSGHQAKKMSCSLVELDLKALCSAAVLTFLFYFSFLFLHGVTSV